MKREMLDKLPFMVEDGVYALKHDVVNRKPDRRFKRQFDAAETWKAGTLIQVRLNLEDEFRLPILRCLWAPYPGMSGDLACGSDNKAQWEPLLNAMDNPPQNICTLMAVLEADGIGWIESKELLAMLMFTNKVDYKELLALAKQMSELEEGEYSRWRKSQGME
jgi:hypothetical protein